MIAILAWSNGMGSKGQLLSVFIKEGKTNADVKSSAKCPNNEIEIASVDYMMA